MGQKKRSWGSSPRLLRKYKVLLMDAQTYEEKISFIITRLGVIVGSGTIFLLLIIGTIYLVAFTSLRQYIPGYINLELPGQVYELTRKTDSLEIELARRNLFLENLRKILSNEDFHEDSPGTFTSQTTIDTPLTWNYSPEELQLREEYEGEFQFAIFPGNVIPSSRANIGNIYFFSPVKGIITRNFNPMQSHYGVDIVTSPNEAVKSVLDGTVIFSDWTLETGHVIFIQHQHQIISVYKHNSVLLKKQGNTVKAGEIIAFVGQSGELQSGPHLHFELWYDGKPVNPEEFITF